MPEGCARGGPALPAADRLPPGPPLESPGVPRAAGPCSCGTPPGGHRATAFLLEAGRRLSASLNTRRCARATAELAASFLADTALVVLPADHARRSAWLRVSAGRPGLQEGTVSAAEASRVPGLAEALAGFPPVPSRWLDPAQAPGWLLPPGSGPAGHLLVTPLPGNGVAAGALVLARRRGGPAFHDDIEALAGLFAARAGAAISAAALHQEQNAVNAVLTAALLPPGLPSIDGVELAGSLRVAHQAARIGGDFYDVFLPAAGDAPAASGRAAAPLAVLGDVCGKGAPAAVLAGQILQSLRALLLVERRPERLAALINRSLIESPAPDSYATMVTAELHRAAGGRLRLDLAAAGHPAPLVLRADGTVEEVPARGTLLGLLPDAELLPAAVDLAPGELCLLYSDGVTEAFGGPAGREMYGEQRLKDALATCAGMPAEAVVQRLEQLGTEWLAGGEHDDRALLAIRARPR
ncbi:serine/threonine-protein phosphatase [Planomonospora sp. ID91781]|uniref:Magnesium/manganese-dependent protein phosphatase n=1 Tax=Planomonospora sphaerica TaxID=161355 RepID=A0A171DQ56_9ACTN|nr:MULTISPECIES: PP2C family protein-serine/threonine phosphatase [Planomonospora]MBG0823208.1 serine/threonine-protein phosphatase [Planomonospora sp. ID91781]GAT71188.1 magnesium/manganese-dependent protein phosphatase [Planomonospora sphaerica]